MGEAKAKKTATQKLVEVQDRCTYCGGEASSTTRDHAPPIAMFKQRDRPKGLEFGACGPCHEGTRKMDFLASVACRFYSNDDSTEHKDEIARLLKEFVQYYPGLASELQPRKAVVQDGKVIGHAIDVQDAAIVRALEAFGARIAMALYREITGEVVPIGGGAAIRWFSNFEGMMGDIPDDFLAMMGEEKTLKAGSKNVADQFFYRYRMADDNSALAIFAAFSGSFAFAAFVASDASLFTEHKEHIYAPKFLQGWEVPQAKPAVRALKDAASKAMAQLGIPKGAE